MLDLVTTSDEEKQGWAKPAWSKYEYIHKYRLGFRSRGLAQGFALSPVLSVITLIVLEELESKGIKHLLYADDGLFYSEKQADFLSEAQEILDKHGIGAYFNKSKSKPIKSDNIWLSKLKMVGLEYDPFTDILSAATRNGATLKLEIGALGLFSNEKLKIKSIPNIIENHPSDWSKSNDRLIELYEWIYLTKGYRDAEISKLYSALTSVTYLLMKKRFVEHSPFQLREYGTENPIKYNLIVFLTPIRLLRNLHKESHFELVEEYKKWNDSEFPWELILNNDYLKERFWMDEKLETKEHEAIYKRKQDIASNSSLQTQEIISGKGVELLLDKLKWFRQQTEIPDSVKHHFKDGSCNIGDWFEFSLDESKENLPDVVTSHLKKYTAPGSATKMRVLKSFVKKFIHGSSLCYIYC